MSFTRAIFATNNGLADHIGIAQVIPYLTGLAKKGHRIEVISVENSDNLATEGDKIGEILAKNGIAHHPIVRTPGWRGRFQRYLMPSLLECKLASRISDFKPHLLHCRSYMPLGGVMRKARRANIPFVFDMRGFWIDQRIEQGAWRQASPIGRAQIAHFRRLESRAYREAAHIVTLTNDALAVVRSARDYRGAPVSVIPCSVDQQRFDFMPDQREEIRREIGIAPERTVLAYLGSSSSLYRMDLVYRTFQAFRELGRNPFLLMIGHHDCASHIERAKHYGVRITNGDMYCRTVPHGCVPALLSASDIGLSYIIPSPSSLGVSATKVGEYLACGLPVLSNLGIGDINLIIENGKNGFVLRNESEGALSECARAMADAALFDRAAIKNRSRSYFALNEAVSAYDRIYTALAQ